MMSSHDPALSLPTGSRAHAVGKAVAVAVASTAAAACALIVGFGQDSVEVAAALGLAGGIVLVAGLAYARGVVRPVTSAAAIAESLGTRLLASLPAPPRELSAAEELITLAQPASVAAQRFHRLGDDIGSILTDGVRSVLFTSPDPGQGKSTTAANLAVELARGGRRVAVVDLDRRRPRLHRLFKLFRTPGVSEIVRGEAKLDDCLVPIDPAIGTRARRLPPSEAGNERLLYVLPGGAADRDAPRAEREPAEVALIRELEQRFDVVVLDGPPLLHVPEGEALGRLGAATVIVTGIGTDRSALHEALALLDAVAADRVGCVVTAAAPRSRGYRYDDYYDWHEDPVVPDGAGHVEHSAA